MKIYRRIALCLVIMFSMVICPPFAGAQEMRLFFTNTTRATAIISINSNRSATATYTVIATNAGYKISGSVYIEQLKGGKWTVYKSWSTGSLTGKLSITKIATLPAGYSYRSKLVVNVNGEAVSAISSQKSC